MRKENVVEFPTGQPVLRTAGNRRPVALLVRKLAAGARIRDLEPGHRHLAMELCDLAGVSDQTVEVLTALAQSGVVTPASAARLAMRHASEIGSLPCGTAIACEACDHGHHLALAGVVSGRFAVRIEDRTTGAWVARGTFAGLEFLLDVCPKGRGSFYLLPEFDAAARNSVVLRKPRDWRSDLTCLVQRIGFRGDRQILIVGGVPRSGQERAAVIGGIADGLRRSGMLVRTKCPTPRVGIVSPNVGERRARGHLVLIETAFPGLVVSGGGTK